MSSFLNNREKFYKNQRNDTLSVKPNYITRKIREAKDFVFGLPEKRYERNVWKESIIFTLIKTSFESAIEKMELAVALPSLISDPELPRILTTDEIDVINDVFLYYIKFCSECSVRQSVSTIYLDLERQQVKRDKMLEDVIKRYRKNLIVIDEIDKKCNQDVINTTTKYEKKQLVLHKAWEFERNDIRLALESVIDDFESLKQTDIKLDQTIRKQRLTIESKLLAIMAKYDTEIGDRYRMLEELCKIYEYDKLEKYALEKETKRQEALYVNCVKEKEKTATAHLYEIRLATFKRERSARIIQHWWRDILQRKELNREAKNKRK